MSAFTLSSSYDARPFWVAVAISLVLHIAVLAGVRFVVPNPEKFVNTVALDVVLVNSKSAQAPEKPDVLAQTNLDGGGNTDEPKQRAATPLPPQANDTPNNALTIKQARQKSLETESDRLARQLRLPGEGPTEQVERKPAPVQNFDRSALLEQAKDIARLEGEIAERHRAYQTRPRRAFVGGRAREARFARYVEDWRLKIERVGNLNYPQAARDQAIYGSLILSVEIRADGSLARVKIDRSSGEDVLDEAAKNIVKLAAPYSRFPEELARDYDTLTIVRTWSFTRENQLATSGRD